MSESSLPLLRAAIYARVSTEEQREGQAIDSQISELERFAETKGWTITGTYKDEGWSGSLLARPDLDRLRDDASKSSFEIALFNDVDRLARDVAHLGIVKRDLERRNVQVVFRKLPAEQSPTHNLMVNILGSFAEFEREMIVDRTRRGRRYKVEVRQQFLGTIPAYGYRYTPINRASGGEGRLDVMPEEAALIRQMYEWVDREGISSLKVLARLNTSYPPPRKGGKWAKSTVRRILRSEIYAGVWHYNKLYSCEPTKPVRREKYKRLLKSSNRLRPRSEWIPVVLSPELKIIERQLWERVQRQLDKNRVFSPRNTKSFYLLSGLLRCGSCRAAIVGDPSHGKLYYRCSRRCKGVPTIKTDKLDVAVWEEIVKAVMNPKIITEQVAERERRRKAGEERSGQEAAQLGEAVEVINREESRILEAYRTGIITAVQLGQELGKISVKKKALEKRKSKIEIVERGMHPVEVKRTIMDYCAAIRDRLITMTQEGRKSFLRRIVESIIFEGHRVRIKGVLPIGEPDEALDNHGLEARVISNGGIMSTMSYSRVRNPAYEGKHVTFELTGVLPEKQFSILSKDGLALISRLVREQPDPMLSELCQRVLDERGVRVSVSHMSRALKRIGVPSRRR